MKIPRPVWFILITAIVLAVILALDWIPLLRGEVGWQWPYEPAALNRALPLAVSILVYIAGAYWILRRTTRAGWALLWSMVGVIALALLVMGVRTDTVFGELFNRTASTLTTGVYTAGTQIPLDSPAWRNWITLINERSDFGAHVVNGPPGLPLVYSLLSAGLDSAPGVSDPLYRMLLPVQCHNYNLLANTPGAWAAAWVGVLMPLWAALAVVPLYAAARLLPAARDSARGIVLWYPLIPAVGMFAGTWYTVYPAWMIAAFWLLVSGMNRRQPLRLILGGLVMGLSVFMAYALLPVIGFFGLYVLVRWWLTERAGGVSFLRPVMTGLWFGLGLALPWLIYWLWSGETPFALILASLNQHFGLERPYLPWVFLHYWDWMLFSGFTLFLVWYAGLFRRTSEPPVVGISLLAAMLILCLSGTARGETGRVWLAFTPFALLAAGEGLKKLTATSLKTSRIPGGFPAATGEEELQNALVSPIHRMGKETGGEGNPLIWLILALGQAAVLLALTLSLNVMRTDLVPPPPAPLTAGNMQPVNALVEASNRGGAFRLVGWNATEADGMITLNLAWEGGAQNIHPYWFAALLVAPDGNVYGAGVWQPGQIQPVPANSADAPRGTYPTTCWAAGATIGDSVQLVLPNDAAPGGWWISLSVFGDPTAPDGRLNVVLPDGSTDTQIGIGPVPVSQ